MVGSKAADHDPHQKDGHDDDDDMEPSSGVACSICLDLVSDNGLRSRAKLQCGHEFHLDCIGSAFNMKGAMQCPNCRRIEKGQWLYANGSTRSPPELSMEDWIPDEDFYDLSYSEMPFRVHWCPFGEFARLGSSFEEVEPPSTTYHDLRGHNAIFSSSMAHSYVAYVGPSPLTTSRSSNNVDDPLVNPHWNGLSGQNEIFTPHAFPAVNIQYPSWGHQSPPFSISGSHMNVAEPTSIPHPTLRSSHGESDAAPIPRSFLHPLVFDHGSGPRASSSFVSSVFPRRPGSGALTHERLHAFHHLQSSSNSPGMPTTVVPGIRRFDSPRSLPAVVPAPLQHDQNGGFYILPPSSSGHTVHEAENPASNSFHVWEREQSSPFPSVSRDSNWGSFRQTTLGSDMGNGLGSFWHRHSS